MGKNHPVNFFFSYCSKKINKDETVYISEVQIRFPLWFSLIQKNLFKFFYFPFPFKADPVSLGFYSSFDCYKTKWNVCRERTSLSSDSEETSIYKTRFPEVSVQTWPWLCSRLDRAACSLGWPLANWCYRGLTRDKTWAASGLETGAFHGDLSSLRVKTTMPIMKSDREKGALLEGNILRAETSVMAKTFPAVFFIACLCPRITVSLQTTMYYKDIWFQLWSQWDLVLNPDLLLCIFT